MGELFIIVSFLSSNTLLPASTLYSVLLHCYFPCVSCQFPLLFPFMAVSNLYHFPGFPSLLAADNTIFFIRYCIFSKTHFLFPYFQQINRNNKVLNFPPVSKRFPSLVSDPGVLLPGLYVPLFPPTTRIFPHEVKLSLFVFNLQPSA